MASTITLVVLVVIIILALGLAIGVIWLLRRQQTPKKEPAKKQSASAKKEKQTNQQSQQGVKASPAKPAASSSSTTPANATPRPSPRPSTPSANHQDSLGEAGEKIRILIVDDNPDTRDNVSRLLYFEKDMEVIGQAVNGRQGLEMAAKLRPHIVLMDINMPDMDGITATREMSVKTPYCQVIIISVQAEQHYMKQAMMAGARDFQPKPFTADELVSCIHRVYKIGLPVYQQIEAAERNKATLAAQPQVEVPRSETGAPVIALYSPKGGIGTSTIAANLAIALQQQHGDTVLMDADLQFGDILVHLNTKATRTITDLVQNNELDTELLPEIVLSHNSGLKLLLAPSQPELADAITPEMVTEIIKGLKKHFKIVLIDTSSHLNDKTLAVLENADYILVIMSPELPSIKSTKLFLELADQLEFAPTRLGVIMNRATLPGGIPLQKIERALKLQRTHHIPDDPRLHLAINKGVAVTQQDPGAPSAQAITALAEEVWQKLETKSAPMEEAFS